MFELLSFKFDNKTTEITTKLLFYSYTKWFPHLIKLLLAKTWFGTSTLKDDRPEKLDTFD